MFIVKHDEDVYIILWICVFSSEVFKVHVKMIFPYKLIPTDVPNGSRIAGGKTCWGSHQAIFITTVDSAQNILKTIRCCPLAALYGTQYLLSLMYQIHQSR